MPLGCYTIPTLIRSANKNSDIDWMFSMYEIPNLQYVHVPCIYMWIIVYYYNNKYVDHRYRLLTIQPQQIKCSRRNEIEFHLKPED